MGPRKAKFSNARRTNRKHKCIRGRCKKYVNIPDSYIGKISIVNGELAYDINKFSKEEQLIFKTNYGFKATEDNISPYGSIEKKIKNKKVQLTVFSADDESDVYEIILPDGTSKKIQYDTESIWHLLSKNKSKK